jgi:hypothetical protein
MDFPADWDVFPSADFDLAVSRMAGLHSVELMAQIRPNGRIMDHWRLAMGGNGVLEIDVKLDHIIPVPAPFPDGWRLKRQYWPRDVEIRRNMTTGGWEDVYEALAARQAQVVSEDGTVVTNESVITLLDDLPPTAVKTASLRWAIVASEAGNLQLDLQSLPATSKALSGKPAFKG